MDTAIIIAVLSFFGSAILFFLTKWQERTAEWRRHKLDHYKEFVAAANALLENPDAATAKTRFANAGNNIWLVGSSRVLAALDAYLDSIADPRNARGGHDELLTQVIRAIRRDIGLEWKLPKDFRIRLRASGKADQA